MHYVNHKQRCVPDGLVVGGEKRDCPLGKKYTTESNGVFQLSPCIHVLLPLIQVVVPGFRISVSVNGFSLALLM